jgi:hypothetical protein
MVHHPGALEGLFLDPVDDRQVRLLRWSRAWRDLKGWSAQEIPK